MAGVDASGRVALDPEPAMTRRVQATSVREVRPSFLAVPFLKRWCLDVLANAQRSCIESTCSQLIGTPCGWVGTTARMLGAVAVTIYFLFTTTLKTPSSRLLYLCIPLHKSIITCQFRLANILQQPPTTSANPSRRETRRLRPAARPAPNPTLMSDDSTSIDRLRRLGPTPTERVNASHLHVPFLPDSP